MPKTVTPELWNRIKKLLPSSHDPTLVLLKGHLLIEEQLFALIAAHCRDTTKLEDARLSFNQKLRLAQALSGVPIDLYCSLEKLNALRNRMAHHAEVPDLDSRLDEYLRAWAEDDFVRATTRRKRTRDLRKTLIFQIGRLYGMSETTDFLKHKVSYAHRT